MRANFFSFSICSMLTLASFSALAQKNFDSKKHEDTVVDKSALNAIQINSDLSNKHFLKNGKYQSFNNSISLTIDPAKKNLQQNSNLNVVYGKESGLPIFISSRNINSSQRTINNQDVQTVCFNYLNSISAITKIQNPEQNFSIKKIEKDALGKTHIKLTQNYKGVKVFASEIIVHLNQSNVAEIFNGNYHLITKDLNVQPAISQQAAIATVISNISSKTKYKELSDNEKATSHYNGPIVETVIYEDHSFVKTYFLAYHITIKPNLLQRWEYFVDAQTGVVINSYPTTCHVDGPTTATANDLKGMSRTVNAYLQGTTYSLVDVTKSMYNASTQDGSIVTLDANNTYGANFQVQPITNTTNTWTNPTAVSAHYNAGVAFDYYKNAHNRNSIDGNGGTIYSIINVTEDGSGFDNAYWDGSAMYYGNGDVAFTPLAKSLDVAGHEMTHGVVQNSANLTYQGESGAINESMADIFGVNIDSTNWLIGDDVVQLSHYPTGALRSFIDPHNGGSVLGDPGYQPRVMSEKYMGTFDNGGVHINSGIPNWAYYKLATALGSRNKAVVLFYRALTQYLTASSQFIDLRLAVIQSATDLYGAGSNEVTQVGLAFDAVGIVNGSGTVINTTLPTNPGTEYLLSYDTNSGNPNGLYRSTPNGTSFAALLTKSLHNKPSVTDDGSAAVFVGTDKKIYAIDVNPAHALNLTLIQNNPVWSNVAISKDGNRMAAVTFDADTSIYVFDFNTSQVARFELYNPTFTPGVKAKGPVYADVIEWSYDGEYLVYDCFNSITNSGGNIEFWDINMIKVWDNTLNDFSDGEVVKLFNQLSEGESVGNPTFSKNGPYIIAFDYFDLNSNTAAILGFDIENSNLGLISYNNYNGKPCYNKFDNRIAFATLDGLGNPEIDYVPLNSDKISSGASTTPLVGQAEWPVYFTVGVRVLSNTPAAKDAMELVVYPNPTKGELSILLPKDFANPIEVEVYNQLGSSMMKQSYDPSSRTIKVNMSELSNGIYFLNIKSSDFSSAVKFIKQE